jgi:DNA-binding transcriptional ArsR family regulator
VTSIGDTNHSLPDNVGEDATEPESGTADEGVSGDDEEEPLSDRAGGDGTGDETDASGPQDGAVDDSADASENGHVDEDALFEVLSNRRRRYALHYLMQVEGETVDLGDISTQVAAWENGIDPDDLGYRDRKAVHTSLYQYHVPKLDDAGIVEYDSQRGVVRPTGRDEAFDVYLETVAGRDIPWGVYFLLLSGALTALATGAWLGVPVLAALSGAEWGLVVSVAFLVSSCVFACESRYRMRIGTEGPPPEVRDR